MRPSDSGATRLRNRKGPARTSRSSPATSPRGTKPCTVCVPVFAFAADALRVLWGISFFDGVLAAAVELLATPASGISIFVYVLQDCYRQSLHDGSIRGLIDISDILEL
jgi:hypothetical protein